MKQIFLVLLAFAMSVSVYSQDACGTDNVLTDMELNSTSTQYVTITMYVECVLPDNFIADAAQCLYAAGCLSGLASVITQYTESYDYPAYPYAYYAFYNRSESRNAGTAALVLARLLQEYQIDGRITIS